MNFTSHEKIAARLAVPLPSKLWVKIPFAREREDYNSVSLPVLPSKSNCGL